MTDVRRSLSFEAGALVRGSVLYQMQAGALRHGVKLEHAEDRGWLSSHFTFVVSGDTEKVNAYMRACQDYFKRLEE